MWRKVGGVTSISNHWDRDDDDDDHNKMNILENVWRTTLHLVNAAEATFYPCTTPISRSSTATAPSTATLTSMSASSHNILHAITTIGHYAHSAMLWFALQRLNYYPTHYPP